MQQTFNIPATIIVGAGASRELAAQARQLGARRALLVTDRFLEQGGTPAHFASALADAGVETRIFADVQPDPTDRNVADGLEALREHRADLVIAVGGGSPIDAAKAIAIMATNSGPLRAYKGYHQIPQAGLPLIAVPTTAGTGSEATRVAVITDTEHAEKMMILDRYLVPVVALVDYELSMSMPPALSAHVGVDTLTHGIEAYVSRKAGPLTDPIARSCIELCARFLVRAFHNGADRDARAGMAVAACQGGMAFANSSVCLVHGMSRPLGAVFHLPHGLSNAVLLPAVTRFSLAGATGRYAEVARIMGLAGDNDSDDVAAVALADGLEALNATLGIPRLRDCTSITAELLAQSVAKMAEDALASGSPQNNPVIPSAAQIEALYQAAF
jgi:alcohol dehydrogenase class IV